MHTSAAIVATTTLPIAVRSATLLFTTAFKSSCLSVRVCMGHRFFASSIQKELGDGEFCRAVVPTCTHLPPSWQRRRFRLPCNLRRCSLRRPFMFLGSRVMCQRRRRRPVCGSQLPAVAPVGFEPSLLFSKVAGADLSAAANCLQLPPWDLNLLSCSPKSPPQTRLRQPTACSCPRGTCTSLPVLQSRRRRPVCGSQLSMQLPPWD